MTIDFTKQDCLNISLTGALIAHSGFVYYFNSFDKRDKFKGVHSFTPLTSIASIAAGSYCYATNTPPQPLQKIVMYGFVSGNTIYTAYKMYQKPSDSFYLVTALIINTYRHYKITNDISSLVEKFVTDKVEITIENTDIQLIGGATSIGVQWSSTDDPTDANLTGNAEPESTT